MIAKGGYVVYPRGFARYDEEAAGTVPGDHNDVIGRLYVEHIEGTSKLGPADLVVKMLDLAGHFLGLGSRWIITQRENPNLSAAQVEFVEDTINYIVSGKRRMYIGTWLSLTDEPMTGQIKPMVAGGGRVANPSIVVPPELSSGEPGLVIARWLSQDQGLSDMICALNLMFGGVPYIRGITAPTL